MSQEKQLIGAKVSYQTMDGKYHTGYVLRQVGLNIKGKPLYEVSDMYRRGVTYDTMRAEDLTVIPDYEVESGHYPKSK